MTEKICTFCVMDSSNPGIEFDANGRCNCCRDAEARKPFEWWPNEEGQRRLKDMIDQLRINLERARWLLHDLKGDFVLVDIAGYKIYFYKQSIMFTEENFTKTPT